MDSDTTVFFSVWAQDATDKPTVSPNFYFNNFQDYHGKNVDSAMYYIRLLAVNDNYGSMLERLIHDSFAQSFRKISEGERRNLLQEKEFKRKLALRRQILNLMTTDSIQSLAAVSTPVYYWVQAQQYENDASRLEEITNGFIMNQLSADDIYHNRVGRYALLIHQVISRNDSLNVLSDRLLGIVFDKLKWNPALHADTDTGSPEILTQRSWFRYLFAYLNYALASQLLEKENVEEAGKYLLAASDYSPDSVDRGSLGYFYDMHFLVGKEKHTFQDDYINYLKQYSSDKANILDRLLVLSLTDPTFKKELEAYYISNFSKRESFAIFWRTSINQGLKNAPSFTLRKINREKFSLKEKQGKWLLLDFWGTWCGPCRQEHPDLQKFYMEYVNRPDFELLTIACNDNNAKVKNYMQEKGYNFPVVMSDNKVENLYRVRSYPSKFLITPEGNLLAIPLSVDWVSFIQNYIGL